MIGRPRGAGASVGMEQQLAAASALVQALVARPPGESPTATALLGELALPASALEAAGGARAVCAVIIDEVVARHLGAAPGALVWSGPPSGDVDYTNGAWRVYTGAGGEPPASTAWQDAIHPGDRPACVYALAEASAHGACEIEARMHRADGALRRHRVRFASQARGARWFCIAEDREDLHLKAESAARLAQESAARSQAEQLTQLKDRFFATLSHELRTPLTTMLLWERVLRDGAATAELRAQALDAIHQSAMAQSHLIGDLIDVSRAMSGKLRIDLRPLDLQPVLQAAIDDVAAVALAKGVALAPPGAPLTTQVQADEPRLRQVLNNLLTNAVKFTPPGGRIEVSATRQEGAVVIIVRDTGRGIEPDAMARLFEPFTQIDTPADSDSGSGLGLGLVIAKQLATLHHGELGAASEGAGRGAAFTLKLPIATAAAAPQPVAGGARKTGLPPIRILVVDDDLRVLDALSLLLSRVGAVVDTADSAAAARHRISLQAPDALLCDIAMPTEDGLSLIRELRRGGLRIPAIALTAYAMKSDVERALSAGFDLHIAKPIVFDRLVEQIAELLSASEANRPHRHQG